MLEEARMDKKSVNRSSLQQSRTTSIDCKKSTELTHNKPWPRNNKKSEGSNGQKNEPNRKNVVPQRGRGQIDRRPRNRGPSSSLVGGTQNTGVDEDEEPKIGSVFVPGSKKQNLNHLLNFMYPSRGGPDRRNQGIVPRRQQRISYKHEHDLYLRAYCQFVVREAGDYKVNLLDPDIPVKWDEVEEIVVRSTGRSECPICLGVPVAGRVGHCGHVYCWACMLHYSATHDKQPPPCPVCAMPIQVSEMKPTKMVQWESPADEVTMRLVRRLRGSAVVEIAPPRGHVADIDDAAILPLIRLNDAPFAKLFTASKQQVFDILDRERKELQAQILAEIDTTELVYLEQALEMLKIKEEKIKAQYEQCTLMPQEPENVSPIDIQKQDMSNNTKLDWFDVSEEGAACTEIIQDEIAELVIQSNLNPDADSFVQSDINENQLEESSLTECSTESLSVLDNALSDIDKENQAKYFYFYQASDGQQVFLHSLNIRMLNASWGALAAAPPLIRGRVLHRETLSLSDQTRKHMPHTAHLPLHCSFDIVEIELQPPYVTAGALEGFLAEIDRRARMRARQERDERRRERAYRRAMEGPPKPDFFSNVQFPPAQTKLGSPPTASTPFSNLPVSETLPLTQFEEINPSGDVSAPLSLEQASPSTASSPPSTGLSFAKMASTSGTWRVRKSAPAPPPPADDEDDGGGPRALVLSDAIEAALRVAPARPNKKSKKSKPKLLFATGMQHST